MATTLAAAPAAAAGGQGSVEVVELSVDGRADEPLGIDNTTPLLGWQMIETRPCHRVSCPADRQTAYQIQAATSEANLRHGKLIWDTGKVSSATQTGIPYA